MFHTVPFLAAHMYVTGKGEDVKSGDWTASNYLEGEPVLGIVVRRRGEIVADARITADTVDGVSDIAFADPKCGHGTKRRAVAMLRLWVSKNREVYPRELGTEVPKL